MKENFSDLEYLLNEIKGVSFRFRSDVPEDFYKIILDLVYHANKIVKDMEVEYDRLIETWDCSVCELHGLPRK